MRYYFIFLWLFILTVVCVYRDPHVMAKKVEVIQPVTKCYVPARIIKAIDEIEKDIKYLHSYIEINQPKKDDVAKANITLKAVKKALLDIENKKK